MVNDSAEEQLLTFLKSCAFVWQSESLCLWLIFKETHDFSSPMRATQMVLGFSEWILEFSSPRGGDKALVVNQRQACFYTSTDLLDFHPFLGGWYLFYHKMATRKKKSKYTPFIILTNKIYYKLVNWKQRNWKKNSKFFQKNALMMESYEWSGVSDWLVYQFKLQLYFIKSKT